ncbi:MAG: thioredoxin family protein [Bacteroidetes bacterium]|jgi:hypothetical protein|nr:thioredoxin family protein [Bacteroidota bacterium]
MKNIIQQSLQNSLSYTAYRQLINDLLTEGKSTGTTENPDYLQFSELNKSRMNRLDKTLKVLENHKQKLLKLTTSYTWLVISEGWCGDAAQILPVLNKLAEVSDNIDLRIVIRDENLELMDQFLTNGNRAIPILLILDAEMNVVNQWGPRPLTATQMVLDYKTKYGLLDADFKIQLQTWYNENKGIEIQNEVMNLF